MGEMVGRRGAARRRVEGHRRRPQRVACLSHQLSAGGDNGIAASPLDGAGRCWAPATGTGIGFGGGLSVPEWWSGVLRELYNGGVVGGGRGSSIFLVTVLTLSIQPKEPPPTPPPLVGPGGGGERRGRAQGTGKGQGGRIGGGSAGGWVSPRPWGSLGSS